MSEEYKGYLIFVVQGKGGMRGIKAKGKGSVVKVLRGLYTSIGQARLDIDKYLTERKEKTNGKAKNTD